LRRCAGIFPSSAITNLFASFPFITFLLLASINGYLSVLLSVSFKRMPAPLRLSSFVSPSDTTPFQLYRYPSLSPLVFFSTRGAFLLLLKASRQFLIRFILLSFNLLSRSLRGCVHSPLEAHAASPRCRLDSDGEGEGFSFAGFMYVVHQLLSHQVREIQQLFTFLSLKK
jgi:hypothetical protein